MRVAIIGSEEFRQQKDNVICTLLESGHEIFDIERLQLEKQQQFLWKADCFYVISDRTEDLPPSYTKAIAVSKIRKVPIYSTIPLPEASMRSPIEVAQRYTERNFVISTGLEKKSIAGTPSKKFLLG